MRGAIRTREQDKCLTNSSMIVFSASQNSSIAKRIAKTSIVLLEFLFTTEVFCSS